MRRSTVLTTIVYQMRCAVLLATVLVVAPSDHCQFPPATAAGLASPAQGDAEEAILLQMAAVKTRDLGSRELASTPVPDMAAANSLITESGAFGFLSLDARGPASGGRLEQEVVSASLYDPTTVCVLGVSSVIVLLALSRCGLLGSWSKATLFGASRCLSFRKCAQQKLIDAKLLVIDAVRTDEASGSHERLGAAALSDAVPLDALAAASEHPLHCSRAAGREAAGVAAVHSSESWRRHQDCDRWELRGAATAAAGLDRSSPEFATEVALEAYFRGICLLRRDLQDRDIVLEAVRRDWLALSHAPEAMRGDREILLEAVKQDWLALAYASKSLLENREFVLEAVKLNGLALGYASEILRKDRGVVLAAVGQNGRALEYASQALRSEPAIVLEAVGQHGLALEHASQGLRGDRCFVLEAVKLDSRALLYASEALKPDRTIVELSVGRRV